MNKYNAQCLEWDNLVTFGEGPAHAAESAPGQWVLVYDLRPLELIPYLLGISFRPARPLKAIIYDADPGAPRFYTTLASRVNELGNPVNVRGISLWTRVLQAAKWCNDKIFRLFESITSWAAIVFDILRELSREDRDSVKSQETLTAARGRALKAYRTAIR